MLVAVDEIGPWSTVVIHTCPQEFIVRPVRTAVSVLVGAAAITTAAFGPSLGSASTGEVGSCNLETVTYTDGSVDITNQVDFIVGDQYYEAGCVTVHSVPGKSLTFVDAISYPGWSYKVKDAGGKNRKVSVQFTNPAVTSKVTYVIQPGRVDWKVS
ncbi:MAG: hypothetical protein AB7V43_20845 [Acidimicrobiia bacterium]